MSNTASVFDITSDEKRLESIANFYTLCSIHNGRRWPYVPGQFAPIIPFTGPASAGNAVCIKLERHRLLNLRDEGDRIAGACEPVDVQCPMTAPVDPGTSIASTSIAKPTIPRVSSGPSKRACEAEVTFIFT